MKLHSSRKGLSACLSHPIITRPFSWSVRYRSSDASNVSDPPVDSRWLGKQADRIGKCITFGLNQEQVREAGTVCRELAKDWRELLAGSEGFLTWKGRRGIWRHPVVWGEHALAFNFPRGEAPSEHRCADCKKTTRLCLGSNGHVNNVVYLRYAESARINWVANYAATIDPANKKSWEELWSSRGYGVIIRSIKIDFKFPMQWPDRVTVFHKLRAKPEESHDAVNFDVIILSEKHRRPAARLVEDIVLYDYRKGTKTTMGAMPFMLDAFQNTFQLQEEAAVANRRQARELDERIRALETSSWDREGAVEDMGSARM